MGQGEGLNPVGQGQDSFRAEDGSGNGLKTEGKRPVRTRMRGVVGAGGVKHPATRFMFYFLPSLVMICSTMSSIVVA